MNILYKDGKKWKLEEVGILGAIALYAAGKVALKVMKILMQKAELKGQFKMSNIRHGDIVRKDEVDAMRKKRVYYGRVIVRDGIPHVLINKGWKNVGVLVPWDLSWSKQ